MNKFTKILVLIVALFLVTLVFFPKLFTQKDPLLDSSNVDLKTYTNTEYGFSFSYPQGLTPTATFKSFYHLSDKWKSDDFSDTNTGVNVVVVPVFEVDNKDENKYPRYFSAEFRVGVSSDETQIKNCLISSYDDQTTTEVTIGGTVFKKFMIEDAGMMQYLEGESYRTVHNGLCFALEKVKAGSSYRDEETKEIISDETLAAYYKSIDMILNSFVFTQK